MYKLESMFYLMSLAISRNFSHKTRILVNLDANTATQLETKTIKPSKHSGKDPLKTISLPDGLDNIILKVCKDYSFKALLTDGLSLKRHLNGRHIPIENRDLNRRRMEFVKQVANKIVLNKNEQDRPIDIQLKVEKKAERLMKTKIYSWRPIVYDNYTALQYLLVMAAPEYSVILRIMSDISRRDPKFNPQSFIDFGSGIGTGIWAASSIWKSSIFEYVLIDSSRDMNNLSELILRGGEENKYMHLRNVFHRQFLPVTSTPYNLVLCAYTLLELPNRLTRLKLLKNLWNKCNGYLILIERGTNAGFKLINEARDFILSLNHDDGATHGYVFSPCPHDLPCPRFISDDKTPCKFSTSYVSSILPKSGNSIDLELYSYVVMKKGSRNDIVNNSTSWPRLVRPTLVRSKHAICRMCTCDGKLQEIIFTASKHGKLAYTCARRSRWGDRVPMEIIDKSITSIPEDI